MWKVIALVVVAAAAGYGAYRLLSSGAPPPSVAPDSPAAPPAANKGPAAPAPGPAAVQVPATKAPAPAPANVKEASVPATPTPPPAPPRQTPGRALYNQGQWAQAAAKLVEEAGSAQAPEAADLLTLAGDCQARLNQAPEAEKIWSRVVKDFRAQPAAAAAAFRLGDALVARGDKVAGRAQYAVAYRHPQSAAPDRELLVKKMVELNQELLFSRKPTPDSVVHVVQPGENMTTIGRKYRVEPNALIRFNGLKNANIYPNDKIKVPKGTFSVEISKSRRQLQLFYDDSVAKSFEVAIGREGHDTPAGEFSIAVKEANPNWTMTTDDGRRVVVPYGQPGHMLGTRWMGFAEPHRDIGIHGTPKEEEGKIGGAVSKGCIRMRNAEVEELFDLVPKGTKVTVLE